MTANDASLLKRTLCNERLSLTLANKVEALSPAHGAVREFLEQRGIGERGVYHAELVLEELFINTVRYGYADSAAHYIEVSLHLSDDVIVMTFDDDAQRFDPSTAPMPVLPNTIEEMMPGGLGLILVRKNTKEMRYARAHGRNQLWLSIPRA
jgi:serine/threonine-protein kinase RsbW